MHAAAMELLHVFLETEGQHDYGSLSSEVFCYCHMFRWKSLCIQKAEHYSLDLSF